MRFWLLLFILFSVKILALSQSLDSCMLVGAYTLKRLEMSQQIDSNSRVFPTMRWSLYEQSELLDTLMIHDNFEFNRKVNFRQFHNQTSTGQFVVQQDSFLTLSVLKGQLYTIPKLNIETITNDELVIIERFKTRWIRRTFQKTSP